MVSEAREVLEELGCDPSGVGGWGGGGGVVHCETIKMYYRPGLRTFGGGDEESVAQRAALATEKVLRRGINGPS